MSDGEVSRATRGELPPGGDGSGSQGRLLQHQGCEQAAPGRRAGKRNEIRSNARHFIDLKLEHLICQDRLGTTDIDSENSTKQTTSFLQPLPAAVRLGFVNESTVDKSVSRVLSVLFRVGRFDPAEANPYRQVRQHGLVPTFDTQLVHY